MFAMHHVPQDLAKNRRSSRTCLALALSIDIARWLRASRPRDGRARTMLRKIAAIWLVVVILLPFTAPFSTCDLPQVLAGRGHRTSSSAAALTRAATSAALPPAARMARIRLLPVSPLPASATIAELRDAECDAPTWPSVAPLSNRRSAPFSASESRPAALCADPGAGGHLPPHSGCARLSMASITRWGHECS